MLNLLHSSILVVSWLTFQRLSWHLVLPAPNFSYFQPMFTIVYTLFFSSFFPHAIFAALKTFPLNFLLATYVYIMPSDSFSILAFLYKILPIPISSLVTPFSPSFHIIQLKSIFTSILSSRNFYIIIKHFITFLLLKKLLLI